MLIELPIWAIILLNVVGWPVIHFSFAWAILRVPSRAFDASAFLYRTRRWERGSYLYTRVLRVRSWKRFLPDAATWFQGGIAKTLGSGANADHLHRLIAETCRGELAHWLMMLAAPVFFLWNPFWADLIMIAYAVAANVPCIVVQRFTRQRLTQTIARRRR